MPKNFYLNNRNGVRSSRVDHLKSKQAIGAAPLHVRFVYSFRTEKSFHHSLSNAGVGTWGGLFLTDEHSFSHSGCALFLMRVRSFSHVGAFFFSQKNTEEQNTQGFTETLSQPISQNLTAIFGSSAL